MSAALAYQGHAMHAVNTHKNPNPKPSGKIKRTHALPQSQGDCLPWHGTAWCGVVWCGSGRGVPANAGSERQGSLVWHAWGMLETARMPDQANKTSGIHRCVKQHRASARQIHNERARRKKRSKQGLIVPPKESRPLRWPRRQAYMQGHVQHGNRQAAPSAVSARRQAARTASHETPG